MSDHYEVIFTAFLRDDTPEKVLNELRWHLGLTEDKPPAVEGDPYASRLLLADPDTPLPGGSVASLQRQFRYRSRGGAEHYAWGLLARSYWLDDELGEVSTILDLIAPYVEENGFGGYFRDVNDEIPTVFAFHDGSYSVARMRYS
jgi:hypothetical protein